MQQNKQKAGAMNAARQETSKEANGEHRGEVEEEIWVEKYRPLSLRHVVGQQTPASPANKLLAWLRDWARNNRLGAAAGGAEKKKGFELKKLIKILIKK
jgi:hypothetical protein